MGLMTTKALQLGSLAGLQRMAPVGALGPAHLYVLDSIDRCGVFRSPAHALSLRSQGFNQRFCNGSTWYGLVAEQTVTNANETTGGHVPCGRGESS